MDSEIVEEASQLETAERAKEWASREHRRRNFYSSTKESEN